MTRQQGPFRVLTVCQGNISRSPAAQYLLQHALGPNFLVASAGVGASGVAGSGIDRWTGALLGKCGIDASHHVSRQLNGRIISGAELILTMELSQRSWVSGEVPGVMRRTFTLLEFARLAVAMRGSHPESLEDMVQRAAANRAVYPVAPDGSDEIADPNGRTIEVYRTVFTQIQNAIQGIAQELLRYPQLRSLVKTEPFAGFAP